jgi:chromosome segregation ATPase
MLEDEVVNLRAEVDREKSAVHALVDQAHKLNAALDTAEAEVVRLSTELGAAHHARVAAEAAYNSMFYTCEKAGKDLINSDAEVERLKTELAGIRALEMNHEGACVKLKNDLDEYRQVAESEASLRRAAFASASELREALRDTLLALGGCITDPPCGNCPYCRAHSFVNPKETEPCVACGRPWPCNDAGDPRHFFRSKETK